MFEIYELVATVGEKLQREQENVTAEDITAVIMRDHHDIVCRHEATLAFEGLQEIMAAGSEEQSGEV